jgi:uncharacterized MAPEG superfamily protein
MQPTPELFFLTLTALFTGLLWVPIVLNRLTEIGLWSALKNPAPDARPLAPWALRLASAHRNAIENLVVFAPLALAVSVLQLGTVGTTRACGLYFAARVAHAVVYALGIPVVRTLAFAAGFACQVFLAGRVLQWF